MKLEDLNNLEAIALIENSTELFRLNKYRSREFVESYIGLALARAGFYGTIDITTRQTKPIPRNRYIFDSPTTVVILIEGIVVLENIPVNNGAGNIAYTGFGLLEVDNVVIYDGRGGSGGGGVTYTGTATISTGGISAGESFLNADMQTMWDNLIAPFVAPTFSSFNIQGFNILEVGDSIPMGNQTFTWATTESGNVAPNSIDIIDVTNGNTTIASGLANDGSEVVNFPSPITKGTNTTHQWRIEGENTQAGNFSRTDNVNWRWRYYVGKDASATLLEADIEALSNQALDTGFAGTYAFGAGAGYLQFAFPQSWGTVNSFKDQATNLDVAMEAPYVVNVTNSFGVLEPHNVYRSTNVLNGAITVIVA